jgi:hypothetical protein
VNSHVFQRLAGMFLHDFRIFGFPIFAVFADFLRFARRKHSMKKEIVRDGAAWLRLRRLIGAARGLEGRLLEPPLVRPGIHHISFNLCPWLPAAQRLRYCPREPGALFDEAQSFFADLGGPGVSHLRRIVDSPRSKGLQSQARADSKELRRMGWARLMRFVGRELETFYRSVLAKHRRRPRKIGESASGSLGRPKKKEIDRAARLFRQGMRSKPSTGLAARRHWDLILEKRVGPTCIPGWPHLSPGEKEKQTKILIDSLRKREIRRPRMEKLQKH